MPKEERIKYFFLLPAVVLILSFLIFPLVYSLYLSVTDWQIGKAPEIIGISNYLKALTDRRVHNALSFTLLFMIFTISVETPFALGVAILSQLRFPGNNIFRVIFTAPFFTSPIALSYLSITIFYEEGGPLNNILKLLFGIKVPWISNPNYAFLSLCLIDIWQWTPFLYIIFLAGLESLPREPYEAATIDGASGFQAFRYITIPLLMPVIITGVLLKMIESLKVFDIIYALTGGGPGIATESYTMYIYKTGFRFFRLGYAAALSYILLIMLMILFTFLAFRLRKVYYE
jgi:multiple sugar transport system permease protein